jgi:hypothetical protein
MKQLELSRDRVAGNIIDYFDFAAIAAPHKKGSSPQMVDVEVSERTLLAIRDAEWGDVFSTAVDLGGGRWRIMMKDEDLQWALACCQKQDEPADDAILRFMNTVNGEGES